MPNGFLPPYLYPVCSLSLNAQPLSSTYLNFAHLWWFARTAITKFYKNGCLKQQTYYRTVLECRSSESRCSCGCFLVRAVRICPRILGDQDSNIFGGLGTSFNLSGLSSNPDSSLKCSLIAQPTLIYFLSLQSLVLQIHFFFFLFKYLFTWLCWVLVLASKVLVACSMWDLVP